MGRNPKGFSIERIDNNKGYFLENCKWASKTEQARNHRVSILSRSGINGVSRHKKLNKWIARITADNKSIHLGCFIKLKGATKAREAGERKYW